MMKNHSPACSNSADKLEGGWQRLLQHTAENNRMKKASLLPTYLFTSHCKRSIEPLFKVGTRLEDAWQ